MANLDQSFRLRVAAHIKAIGDTPDGFEAWRADEIAEMLALMPAEGSRFKFLASRSSASSEGVAAGVGNVKVSEDEKRTEWNAGDRSFRCGAYVVAKKGDRDFEVRHVGDVNPEMEAGELLRLCFENGRWEAQLNVPRIFALGPFVLVIGGKFELWKTGF
ncbi:MAG: hypothetical protein CFH10_01331 [Alphaproteobacteria bacterium MarineAlpha4_Bin2]|nr:MAG: hypothetical protein CFH10_01331 [Alphaproteobacteria bacterium MarineAlpha4_Bin2]